MKKSIGARERLYPNPVVMVSCSNGKTDNIITLAWVGTVCSNPPMISISIRPSRYSHEIITASKELVINIPDAKMTEACDFCGTHSGRDIDKFKALNLTKEKGFTVNTPLIKECPVNIECKVSKVINLGTHDMFIGEVVAVHADDALLDRNGRIDYAKARPFVFNGGEYWSLGSKIGSYGYSQK